MIRTKFEIGQEVWVSTPIGNAFYIRKKRSGSYVHNYAPVLRTIMGIQTKSGIDSNGKSFHTEYYDVIGNNREGRKKYTSKIGYLISPTFIFTTVEACHRDCDKRSKEFQKRYAEITPTQREAFDKGDYRWIEK